MSEMPRYPCPSCKEHIFINADICPYCQTKIVKDLPEGSGFKLFLLFAAGGALWCLKWFCIKIGIGFPF